MSKPPDKKIRIHLDGIANLDPSHPSVVRVLAPTPARSDESTLKEKLIESALRLYVKTGGPRAGLVDDCLDFRSDGRSIELTSKVPLKHMTARSHSTGNTVATGPSVSGGVAALIGLSGGFFVANAPPPIGLYGSLDVGVIINASASAVWQLMFCNAPPRQVFDGPPVILIGVNVSFGAGGHITAGGFLMCFNRAGRPLEIFGVGFQAGVGVGVLPVELFISTSAHPQAYFRAIRLKPALRLAG